MHPRGRRSTARHRAPILNPPRPVHPTHLRVLRSGDLDPVLNMATDEALLATPGPPTLRLYGWRPDALSLGRFQQIEDVAAAIGDPPWPAIVRRVTGGGAIHHEHEVTFALTVDAALLPGDVPASYGRIHGAVRAALAALGVPTDFPRNAPLSSPRGGGLCFALATAFDLVLADGRKVLGGAQRRAHGRVLHHASLPLAPARLSPFSGAVDRPRAQVEDALIHGLAAALSLEPRDGESTAAERRSVAASARCRAGVAVPPLGSPRP